jgi:alpha-methylacyl-CoA racemase
MTPPLQGIRIVEFEGIGPGPLAGRMLADMGAQVTVIARRQRVAVADQLGGDKPSPLRRGKVIVPLDLKQPGRSGRGNAVGGRRRCLDRR